MDDLIKRLRALSRHEHSDYSIGDEAADAIEVLREERNSFQWLGIAVQARAKRLEEVLREAQPFIGWIGNYDELHAKIDALIDHDQEVDNG